MTFVWQEFLVSQGDGPQIHEANRLMAAAQLSEVILGFDVQRLKTALTAKPIAFATLITALRRLGYGKSEMTANA